MSGGDKLLLSLHGGKAADMTLQTKRFFIFTTLTVLSTVLQTWQYPSSRDSSRPPACRSCYTTWKNDWKNVSNTDFLMLHRLNTSKVCVCVCVCFVPVGLPSGCGWVWGSRWCPGSLRAGWRRAPEAQTAWHMGRWLSGTPPRMYTACRDVVTTAQRQRKRGGTRLRCPQTETRH